MSHETLLRSSTKLNLKTEYLVFIMTNKFHGFNKMLRKWVERVANTAPQHASQLF